MLESVRSVPLHRASRHAGTDVIQEKVRSVRKRYKKELYDEGGSFDLTIDSTRKRNNNLAEYRLSLNHFPPAPNHSNRFQCVHKQDHLATATPPKEQTVLFHPRAQAPQDQLLNGAKRAKPTQRQKGDEDTSKPAVLKHNLYRLSTQTVVLTTTRRLFPRPVQA